ncbi:MAG: CDP-2,3-bis-(O-geranylgeranyl)-sn-glycerol synthase [Candidatus Thermoplasmatota archaeon]|jgi:CDP-2,3-bis-(O-geranylgeranyl)-sn-glycerol synthase|nr:CDP-2,3-bis-(O-geranylgeranyl)-sn-glycerol synthase [Candidatus Thermoplasmatota archaeon]
MVEVIVQALQSLYLFIPAFAANSAAVISGGHGKMDFGKNFPDGRRILGDGKTWSGFLGGSLMAGLLGVILYLLLLAFPVFLNYPDIYHAALGSLALSFGSLTGDTLGSFVKRRIGIQRGGKGYLLDQLPFVLVALLFLAIIYNSFFMEAFFNLVSIVVLVVVTPPLHKAVNVLGYKLNKKEVPW